MDKRTFFRSLKLTGKDEAYCDVMHLFAYYPFQEAWKKLMERHEQVKIEQKEITAIKAAETAAGKER